MASPVAFSAYPTTTIDYDEGAIVQFDSIVTNIGDAYSEQLSVFQCPSDGIYLFSISLFTTVETFMSANIVKDGVVLLASRSDYTDSIQSSVVVVTDCLASETVWVECDMNNNGLIGNRRSSFSGVLITSYA